MSQNLKNFLINASIRNGSNFTIDTLQFNSYNVLTYIVGKININNVDTNVVWNSGGSCIELGYNYDLVNLISIDDYIEQNSLI